MWFKFNLFLKFIFDEVMAIIGLTVLSPLFLVFSILIKLDSKGPVFFKQGRRTKDGRVFTMYKFRSMVENAESMGTGLFNYENDMRVTKMGRFLRNTSLDELPQLLNVIKGDIALVGPRPCVTYELGDFETLNKKYKRRFRMKGGITGLAQVKGRNENSWEEKVTLDNEYIDMFIKYGIFTDIKVLLLTFGRVFKRADIYEQKPDESLSGAEAAALAEEEIIRLAHIPDEED